LAPVKRDVGDVGDVGGAGSDFTFEGEKVAGNTNESGILSGTTTGSGGGEPARGDVRGERGSRAVSIGKTVREATAFPKRHPLLSAVNSLARMFPCNGLMRLDEDRLLARARRTTGLVDFGGDSFREPFRILLGSLEADAQLNFIGRVCVRNDIVRTLRNRLRLVEDVKRHPEISGEVIRRPLFITGLPRTGSTFLHALLAQDPAARSPQVWEVMHPSPPPEKAAYGTDPRIARTEKELRWIDVLMPDFNTVHLIEATLPQECIAITGLSFISYVFDSMYYVYSYRNWLDRADKRPAYEWHRKFLQHLQWRCPGTHWVLKAPSHLVSLDALLQVYPDAGIIMTHRDPLKVMPSCTSFTAVLRGAFTDRLDKAQLGEEVKWRWEGSAASAIRFREEHPALRNRFFDVGYVDLVRDSVAMVRRIYDHFGMQLTPEAEEAMRAFAGRHRMNKHGVHHYTLEEFGFDPDALARCFRFYTDYFDVMPETHR